MRPIYRALININNLIMKVILLACLILAVFVKADVAPQPGIEIDDYIKMVKGILEGLSVKEEMKKIIDCIDHVPAAVHVLIEAIQKIKDLNIHNIKELVEAIIQVIGAVREIVDDILPCAESSEEIKKLIDKFTHIDFDKIFANLMMKLVKMVPEIMEAKKAIDDKRWEDFGKRVGKCIYILLLED